MFRYWTNISGLISCISSARGGDFYLFIFFFGGGIKLIEKTKYNNQNIKLILVSIEKEITSMINKSLFCLFYLELIRIKPRVKNTHNSFLNFRLGMLALCECW